MENNDLTVVEHIQELRKRLMIIAFFLIIAGIGSFFIAQPLIQFLQFHGDAKTLQLHAFKVTDPMKVYIQVIFVLALVFTSPVILYQLWAFISPGLLEQERKATLRYIPYTFFLFIGGVVFSYLVLLPYMLKWMFNLAGNLDVEQTIGIYEYFQFLMQITLPFGIIFQLPIVMLFLTRLGIVTPMYLGKIRKYAYFALLCIAALIAPPDIMSHMIVTLPLCVLYEISIMVSRVGYRKYLRAEQQREMEAVTDV
ncbi:twin-arginine translocase subunit TatC [Kurthia sibirica]|uniref:Sec-independent protein translocase protein TatC n=1 Tax=Kurthia sibirica TaxID=202750 RepID=A0A2U3AJ36_9BACL|nr:twin-arginine translocase subunit TatC [Kurthia sibirica]PWI24556.1 twin-arginine translocase subunit TatC [Kurthia sibirica]GEK33506.1 Sec-independent protein translocase protein TatCy [Kurthia sibirica]